MSKPIKGILPPLEPVGRVEEADTIIFALMDEASRKFVETRRQERRWWMRINNAVTAAYAEGISSADWEAAARKSLGLTPDAPQNPETALS